MGSLVRWYVSWCGNKKSVSDAVCFDVPVYGGVTRQFRHGAGIGFFHGVLVFFSSTGMCVCSQIGEKHAENLVFSFN